MSRRDYIAIAEIIRMAPVSPEVRGALIESFSAMLAADNERFDAARFQRAATPDAEIIAAAEQDGYERGRAAGSWVLNPGTEEQARALLEGIEEGDPAVTDALPSAPLSGEWADSLLPRDVLAGLGLDDDDDAVDDVLDAFETGYQRGVQDEVVRSAQALLGLDA